jgi:DNA polymerase elongation subunit (family B)
MTSWQEEALKLNGRMSWRAIAKQLGMSKSTVSDWLRKNTTTQATKEPNRVQRVLLLDIESAPTKAHVWGRWKQNVGLSQVLSEGYMLTYSAKWLGDDLIMCNRIKRAEDDKTIVEELAGLIDQADLIVAHNLVKFDWPTIKTRMVFHGMLPPKPVRVVDTLQIAKKAFRFPSNSLDSIAAYLGLERKLQNSGMDLWNRCVLLEDEAMEEMLEYNRQDVIVLEQVYERLAPWYNQHPSVAVLYDDVKFPTLLPLAYNVIVEPERTNARCVQLFKGGAYAIVTEPPPAI